MAKLSSLKAAFRRKKGFSLIAVMIISLVNLAIMGVALQFAVSSSGGGRVNSAMAVKYNLLHSALEEGKARLKESMDNETLPIPRWYTGKEGIDENTPIEYADMLLLSGDLGERTVTLWDADNKMERLGIFGEIGVLTVKIYDMQYKPESVAENVRDLQLLPPSMLLTANRKKNPEKYTEVKAPGTGIDSERQISGPPDNMGAYLIRAALSVYSKDTDENPIHTWSLETSVIQANNKTNDI
jgi:type II secretory pathway pseudopilin PulG